MEVAVGDCQQLSGLVERHPELGYGGGGYGAMRGEIGAAKLDGELAAFGQIIERNPGDVVLDGVRMRYLLADGDLNIKRRSGLDCPMHLDYGNMLFGFPVGGFDMVGNAHD